VSSGLSDPRVKIHIQDGIEFVAQHTQEFDVIITDSPDSIYENGNERERVGVYVVENTVIDVLPQIQQSSSLNNHIMRQ